MAKKNKKNKKNKLSSLILLLFLTVVMLSTATYAWFTSNRTVSIENIDVQVATSSGIQISADGINWKTTLTANDIMPDANGPAQYTTNTNQFPGSLTPVSTDGSVTSGKMNMFYGVVAANKADSGKFYVSASKQTDTKGQTGYYIAFDFFIRLDESSKVYISPGSGVRWNGQDGTDKKLQYAARMGFINEGTAQVTAAADTIQALNTGTTSWIWEPNADGHTATGIQNGIEYYGIGASQLKVGYNGDGTVNDNPSYVSYVGIKEEIAEPGVYLGNTRSSSHFQTVTTARTSVKYTLDPESVTGVYQQFTDSQLSAGITKIRAYMWIEGEDIECENNASGTYVRYNLSLTLDGNEE